MELRGQLRSWNDEKGFGFIRPASGGPEIFAHISAMRGTRRPAEGGRVLYLAEPDGAGRLRASPIRLDAPMSLDDPRIRRKPGNSSEQPSPRARRSDTRWRLPPGLLVLALLGLLPALGMLRMSRHGHDWPWQAYALGSVLAFGFYLHDKRSAQRSRWRIPEARLHLLELFAGWPGAFVAQQVLRHKTRKLPFQVVFWIIVLAHQVAWLDYLYLHRLAAWLAG
ncbi:DUF1294 domain-containing protein [Stutzerimonas chloritidismutans]|uniref:DUF1294 domain-containing protein n=1 Tax=Stutzerimonas chloritidismutans TaxID=203192 RepID=UPI003F16BE4F